MMATCWQIRSSLRVFWVLLSPAVVRVRDVAIFRRCNGSADTRRRWPSLVDPPVADAIDATGPALASGTGGSCAEIRSLGAVVGGARRHRRGTRVARQRQQFAAAIAARRLGLSAIAALGYSRKS